MKGIGRILYDIERKVIIFESLDNNVRTFGTVFDILCNFPGGIARPIHRQAS